MPVAEFEVVEDVEGILLTASELDRLTYALRDLPMKLRTLGEQAYHAGYEDVEGVLVSERELDGIAYALRDLPMKLRGLGVESFRSGYLACIRVSLPSLA